MTPAEIIGSLRRRGILLAPAGDGRLSYRPREALSEAERAVIAHHRHSILAVFDADPIEWRAAVMAAQVLPGKRAMPLLLARPGVRFPDKSCCSCGDPLGGDDRHRCGPCIAAAIVVLETAR